MGQLRTHLKESEESLDMQKWILKNKPFQVNSGTEILISSKSKPDLDEVAHNMTLEAI